MPESKQYSTAQVAQRYQVAPRTVRRWIDAGYFPNALKLSPAQRSDWRIPAGDIEEFDRQRREASRAH